jgi:hypothetical protein
VTVAELTNLESKLGEVIGLAMAAQGATQKVRQLVKKEGDEELARQLEQIRQEAKETEQRSTQVAGTLDGKKTAILKKARETKQDATEMMQTYLGDDADALDGFEFLTMAEAGEVGHWAIVDVLARRAGMTEIQELAQWVKPIQQRHLDQALQGSVRLAEAEDPNGTE